MRWLFQGKQRTAEVSTDSVFGTRGRGTTKESSTHMELDLSAFSQTAQNAAHLAMRAAISSGHGEQAPAEALGMAAKVQAALNQGNRVTIGANGICIPGRSGWDADDWIL